MPKFSVAILITLSLALSISPPCSSAPSDYSASYHFQEFPNSTVTPSAFQPVTKAEQAPSSIVTALNAALRAADQRRHDQSLQDAEVFARAVRQANVDPAGAVRISEIDRQIANAAREHAPAITLAKLRDAQSSAQRYHPNFECSPGSPPTVFETSVSPGDSPFVPTLPNTPDGTIHPNEVLSIYGCGFGSAAASVSIHLNNSNVVLPSQLDPDESQPWSDNLITIDLLTFFGVPDQPATLSITSSNGNTTTFPLSFIALREADVIDLAHGNIISVNHACNHAATDDKCGGAPPGDKRFPLGRTFIDVHYKVCCRSTNSTDIYYFKLKNGFTLPKLDPYSATLEDAAGFGNSYDPESGAIIYGLDGGTTCNFFGHNHSGHLKGASSGPSSIPGYVAQVAFSWHVDGHCSWVEFDGIFIIVGPLKMQYW